MIIMSFLRSAYQVSLLHFNFGLEIMYSLTIVMLLIFTFTHLLNKKHP